MKEKIILFLIALLAGALVVGSFSLGLFSGLENFFEDLLFSAKPVNSDIVILAIDDDSISRIGQWPWPRAVFAEAFSKLNKKPPRAVGLDVIFSEPSRVGGSDDGALSEVLKNISYPVVMPIEASPLTIGKNGEATAVKTVSPIDIIKNNPTVTLGHVNLITDKDGVVRRFPLSFINQPDSDKFLAFSYEILKQSAVPVVDGQSLSAISRIAYSSPPGSIKRIPFWRALSDEAVDLENKIVLIGATAPDLHDEQLTPFSRGTAMAGVEIQANIANMLISGYRLMPLSGPAMLAWLFGAALLPAVIFMVWRRSLAPLFINIIFGIGYLILIILFFERGLAANLLHINFAWILSTGSLFGYRYFVGEKERREIKQVFSKYVSKDVLNVILQDPSKLSLGGTEKEITVFFSDIRGFTTLSEKTTPQELVRILNRYFTVMTEEVLKNGGVLDKYIGDAIMAFWGAPLDDPKQADNAFRASLAMVKKLQDFNAELTAAGDPEINIGIGLYTGPAIVGNIGSEMRFDYTVIGDTVNVASRLEGLNKEYKTHIIIGESTKKKITGDWPFKFLGSAAVKGRKEPLNIYTVDGY